MTAAHRNGDSRACGATTIVGGQSTVFVNGRLWSVNHDVNTDGGAGLNPTHSTVKINGIAVVVVGDPADADSLCPIPGGAHCNPYASAGSGNVTCYG
jgi:uncharacterized Zn-binding protein involved in type VI secretion